MARSKSTNHAPDTQVGTSAPADDVVNETPSVAPEEPVGGADLTDPFHRIEVVGTPRPRTWTDGDGNERETVEVHAYRVQFLRATESAAPAATSEQEAA